MYPKVAGGRSILLLAALVGCSAGEDAPPPQSCGAGELVDASGACLPPGIEPQLCAAGFEGDGAMGCIAILPSAPCGDGQLARPGELSCRPVGECGEGKWRDAGVAGPFVDQSYTGTDSDGTEQRP